MKREAVLALAHRVIEACRAGEVSYWDLAIKFEDEPIGQLSEAIAAALASGELFSRYARDGNHYRAGFNGPGVDIDAVHRKAAA